MGALCREGVWYEYPTADAVVDTCRGVLYIAVDPDPDPGDWAAVCGLIAAVGWDNGSEPHRQDPGEPRYDPLGQVYTWRLEYASPPPCIWCDGEGTRSGCPLCRRVALGYPPGRPRLPLPLSWEPGLSMSRLVAPMMRTW
jgi:hypothetical protein